MEFITEINKKSVETRISREKQGMNRQLYMFQLFFHLFSFAQNEKNDENDQSFHGNS